MVGFTSKEQAETTQRLARGQEIRAKLLPDDLEILYQKMKAFPGLVEGLVSLYAPRGQPYDRTTMESRARNGLVVNAIDNIIVRTRNEKGDAFTDKDSAGIRELVEEEFKSLHRGYPRRKDRQL
jgi:hypothetical protein